MNEYIGMYILVSLIAHLLFVAGLGDFLSDYGRSSKLEKITHWYVFLTPITFLFTIPISFFAALVCLFMIIWLAVKTVLLDAIKYWLEAKNKLL
jgi:hypothetical protein